MKKILFEDACILNTIRLARFLARLLPGSVSRAVARGIAGIVCRFSKRSRIAYKNLRMVYAAEKSPRELEVIARRSIENLALAALDLLHIPEMTREHVEKNFTIEGAQNFEPYLNRQKGILFLTGHFGSWELLNIASGLKGYPAVVLARVQKHPRSDAYLNQLRRSKGSQVIHKGMPVREILRALKAGKIVGILSDQDGGKNGIWVDFFGRLSSTPAGAATFALRTDSPIFPTFITRERGGRHRISVEPALEFPPADWPAEKAETFLLQQFAASLEARVRKDPEQWLWAHRRWKSTPDRRILVLSDGKAGHVNQSLAVLEALRRERKTHGRSEDRLFSTLVEVKFQSIFWQKTARALSLLLRGHLPGRRFWMKRALTPECYETLLRTYADVVLSCGSSLVDVNLWMKKENLSRSIVVMKPVLPSAHFDAVIAPMHDKLESEPQVFTTDGALSMLRSEDLEVEAGVLAAELDLPSAPRLGILLGGDTASLHFERPVFEALMRRMAELSQKASLQILLTTSRRTPRWADEFLKQNYKDRKLCPLLLIANEANRRGAVAGILGLSDVLVVTAESMSMVSEAVSTGKPVLVIRPWSGMRLKPKYELYLERLQMEGRIVNVSASDLDVHFERAFSGAWPADQEYRLREHAVLAQAARRILI